MNMGTHQHPLFQSALLHHHALRNRTVVAPMSRISASPEGIPTADMIAYYETFARGGFGMIITEGNYTDSFASKAYHNQPGLTNAAQTAGWKTITDAVRPYGTPIIAQLMHAGALSQCSDSTLAPSAIRPVGQKLAQYGGAGCFPLPAAMSIPDIQNVTRGFAAAALAAFHAGFDGVEIHAANGYLLDQFLTPELNIREDTYGGNTENRFRIIAGIIGAIRKTAPADFLVGLRLSEGKVNDLAYRWARGIDMAREIMAAVKQAAPDFLHIAVQTGEWERDSFYANGDSYASVARRCTGIPVIANGGLHDLDKSKIAFTGGHADFVSIGKAALADPSWPNHTLRGIPVLPFHRDMLWPEATIRHTKKIIDRLSAPLHLVPENQASI